MNLNKDGFGNPEVVTDTSASVANAAMSIDTDVVEWVNVLDVAAAKAILTFTPSATTTVADEIKLYSSRNLVDLVKNETFPSLTSKRSLLATFVVDASAAEQTLVADIALSNVKSNQGFEFAIENLLTTVSIDAGWTLTIVPVAS